MGNTLVNIIRQLILLTVLELYEERDSMLQLVLGDDNVIISEKNNLDLLKSYYKNYPKNNAYQPIDGDFIK